MVTQPQMVLPGYKTGSRFLMNKKDETVSEFIRENGTTGEKEGNKGQCLWLKYMETWVIMSRQNLKYVNIHTNNFKTLKNLNMKKKKLLPTLGKYKWAQKCWYRLG